MSLVSHRAVRVLAEHLARSPKLEGAAVDELCQAHPALEASLRRLAGARAQAQIEAPQVAITPGKGRGGKKLRGARPAPSRYVLLGEIARGGGAAVILHVWDTVLERALAMKILDTEGLPNDPQQADDALERFLSEARTAAQLEHPGVVPIHDLGVDQRGRPYFTMPFFEGRTLEEVFELARARSEGWSLGRALLALARVSEVMAYAHARGVVHRDLKPSNLMVGAFGEIYVVDWGLAKVLDSREPEPPPAAGPVEAADGGGARVGQTLDGTVAGSPPYMAPEQAEGRVAELSYGVDVYALGAMLYRLLSGRAPYAPREGHEEPEKTVELIRRGPPTPLQRLVPEAPAELVAISERAMARRPEERYASVADLARDLHAFVAERLGDGEKP